MARRKKNPFYVLLMFVGVAFTLTACSYGVMVLRQASPERFEDPLVDEPPEGSLMYVMDKHGFTILMLELAMLALLTCAAILTDDYWEPNEPAEPESSDDSSASPDEETEAKNHES